MRFAIEPVGFPKTKVGNWKFPAIFQNEEVGRNFCKVWYKEQLEYEDCDIFILHKDELLSMVEDTNCLERVVACCKSRITDDLLYVWCTLKGYFLVREF